MVAQLARCGRGLFRRFATFSAEHQQTPHAHVVPFDIDELQARRRFLAWQSGAALQSASINVRPVQLPFWMFDVRARVEYKGNVEVAQMGWCEVGWKELPHREYSWQHDRNLRVYASFKYRRDYAQVANEITLKRLQPLPKAEAATGAYISATIAGRAQGACLDPPTMQQAIAWEFVVRDIRERERRAAEERLLMAHGSVRNVHVRLHVLERRVQLAFLPCFHLKYEYGLSFNAHGERVPARHEAIISGTAGGGVAGVKHFSPQRAGSGVVLAALGASAAVSLLLGLDPWSLVNLEAGFALFVASTLAGTIARMLPLWLQRLENERRTRASDAEIERVISMGMGPLDTGTDEQEFLRTAAEWRRWEGVGSGWQEHKQQSWAEGLWSAQERRRLEREHLRFANRVEHKEIEKRREERRQQRCGHGSSHQFRREDQELAGGVHSGRRADWLGLYKTLGLPAQSHGHVTSNDVKRAFRRAAMRWHPDKNQEVGARAEYQRICLAYHLLRDPGRRQAYDRGEAIEM